MRKSPKFVVKKRARSFRCFLKVTRSRKKGILVLCTLCFVCCFPSMIGIVVFINSRRKPLQNYSIRLWVFQTLSIKGWRIISTPVYNRMVLQLEISLPLYIQLSVGSALKYRQFLFRNWMSFWMS